MVCSSVRPLVGIVALVLLPESYPSLNWCNIKTPIIDDAAAETGRPDVDTKLQNFQTKFQTEYGKDNTCFFEVPFDDNMKCRCMLKSTLGYVDKQVRCIGMEKNAFEVSGTPQAGMQLYVVSSEAVRVKLDAGESVPVSEYKETRIGAIQQSAADEIERHNISITRVSNGVTKSEPFSVCVHRSLYAQNKRTTEHVEFDTVGKCAEMRNMLLLIRDMSARPPCFY